jgi:hypothetical protein
LSLPPIVGAAGWVGSLLVAYDRRRGTLVPTAQIPRQLLKMEDRGSKIEEAPWSVPHRDVPSCIFYLQNDGNISQAVRGLIHNIEEVLLSTPNVRPSDNRPMRLGRYDEPTEETP